MAETGQHHPEIIESDKILHRGAVNRVETKGEIARIYASISVAIGSLIVGCVILGLAAYTGNTSLQNWATGLISAVSGAAISYGFNSRQL